MNPNKFTQKVQEALQSVHSIATEFSHQELTNEHFLLALLQQSEGIVRPLLEKIGVPADALEKKLQSELSRRPKVTGAISPLSRVAARSIRSSVAITKSAV